MFNFNALANSVIASVIVSVVVSAIILIALFVNFNASVVFVMVPSFVGVKFAKISVVKVQNKLIHFF